MIRREINLSKTFVPLLWRQDRYLILVGGGGSGKSEFCARKIYHRCRFEGGHRFLVLRKVRATINESCIKVMRSLLEEMETPYDINLTSRKITFLSVQGLMNEVLFDGLDEPQKIKSIKGITSVWMEETTDFTKEDFMQVDLRLREETGHYHQIMCSFNPDEAQAPWLKDMFFFDDTPQTGPGKKRDSYIHHSTLEDNPVEEVRNQYKLILDDLDDPVFRRIYRSGLWAKAKGLIFPNWSVGDLPDIVFDDSFNGIDFGFSVNPAAVVRIFRKGIDFWAKEILYGTGYTNHDLAVKIKEDPDINEEEDTYCDASEPKSIEELHREGINAKPTDKGSGSVRAGIDLLSGRSSKFHVHITTDSPHIIEERKSYKRKVDKNGNELPEPAKFKDHTMDAIRGAIWTYYLEYMAEQEEASKVYHRGMIEQAPVDRDAQIRESIARTRRPPLDDEEKKRKARAPDFEMVRDAVLKEYDETGTVDMEALARELEVQELAVRNAVNQLGLVIGERGKAIKGPAVVIKGDGIKKSRVYMPY